MRKIIIALSIISISWASCTKEKGPQVLTKQQIRKQVDSIMTERNKDLEQQGKKDLQSRLKIEVKVKADSIVTARLNPPKVQPAKPAGTPAPLPQAPHNIIDQQGPTK